MVVMVAISFQLISPILYAHTEGNLPACCRRDGKHGCAMRAKLSTSTTWSGVKAACPECPLAKSTPAPDRLAAHRPHADLGAALPAPAVVAEQMEILRRIAFSRSAHKRGPPSSQA